MNILITGAKGFIGKNLCARLKNININESNYYEKLYPINILEYDIDSTQEILDEYCSKADFVFNLAGVNRPVNEDDFLKGNYGFASQLLDTLKKHNNNCPVMLSSSIQAALDNPYGRSKKTGEDLFFNYSRETGAKVLVYRFPNVFGKWCKPNYNSVMTTFCNNIARDIPIKVNDRNAVLNLVYIDDVVTELINALVGNENRNGKYCEVPTVYTITLGEIVDLIYSFKNCRKNLDIPNLSNSFVKKLYSTYLSYLPEYDFSYSLKMNIDNRGSFTEIFRTLEKGQFSINITKPGVTKGNHWHNTKIEKFIVVSGKGLIRFRKIETYEIIEYYVSGELLEVVDIPPGYTHSITNIGDTDLITLMWSNECYDIKNPDTIYEEV